MKVRQTSSQWFPMSVVPGTSVTPVAVLVAIGVNAEGFREILGVMEGAKEDTESWRQFLRHLKERGLRGVRLLISDKCQGLVEALGEFFPQACWQRCESRRVLLAEHVHNCLRRRSIPTSLRRAGLRERGHSIGVRQHLE